MDAGITTEELITTKMVGETVVETESFRPVSNLDDYSHSFTEIKSFLARPFYVSETDWTQAAAVNADIAQFSIGTILNTNVTYRNKLSGYNLIRGTAVVRIQLNANPFQQGKLLMHFVPVYDERYGADSVNKFMLQKTQHPGVQLDCRETEAVIKIPYVTPNLYYDLTTSKYDWGRLFLTVLAPLRMDPATTSTNVQISTWISFEDVEVAAPIPVIAHMDAESKAFATRPLSTSLKAAGKILNSASGIPGLGQYTAPLAWAADISSKLAYTLGYSKPLLNDTTSYVMQQNNRYSATADGHDVAYPLSLSAMNCVKSDASISIRNEDEMSFAYIKGVQCHFTSFFWTLTTPIGNLATLPIAPYLFYQSDSLTVGTHTMGVKSMAPFAHLSQYFSQWRGGVELTIKFAKTQFHSGRLEFVWCPGNTSSGTSSQNIGAMRTIVDVRFSDEIVVKLPWLIAQSYLSPTEISGTFYINVVNQLKAPSNVSTTVDVLIFVRAMDDYEVAVPFPATKILPIAVLPHSDVLDSSVIGGQKEERLTTTYAEASVGEQFLGIKQLLLRYGMLFPITTTGATGYSYAVNPYFFEAVSLTPGTGALVSPSYGGSLFSHLGSMYAFYRGGMRCNVRLPFGATSTAVTNEEWNVMLLSQASLPSANPVQAAVSNSSSMVWNNPTTTSNWLTSSGFVTHKGNSIYASIPYYSDTRCSMVQQTVTNSTPSTGDTPYMFINFYQYNGDNRLYNLSRAVADDFRFSYFVSTPLLCTSFI